MFKRISSLTRAVCAAHHRLPQWHLPTYGDYRPTQFEPNPSIGLACSVDEFFLQGFTRWHVARAT